MLKKIKTYYSWGGRFLNDPYHQEVKKLNEKEFNKAPTRTKVINFLLSSLDRETKYLEIGVRNPADNYDHIISKIKYSVDPGIEFKENPVDFKLTSDEFFKKLKEGTILEKELRFDVIFIDGMHLAEQVDRDIQNALEFIKGDGFIVLHDCNPPSEWHAREEHNYRLSPAGNNWNGTTWKAFVKWRQNPEVFSCCIDTDWGVGVISKTIDIGQSYNGNNEFFEYSNFKKNRESQLNLLSFSDFRDKIKKNQVEYS
ncbi:MAG: class I SAM-dependent methyltransferase [Brumimicrobium sp.]